ncbi:hypothetical protein EGW08_016136, partial [Elysia chlorotica]
RVSLPVRPPDSPSSSSSSSPEPCSERTFTFQTLGAESSVHQFASVGDPSVRDDPETERDRFDSLTPEIIDPSQILSPSKRKAYERRIERLKVTTSPIARPRSTTPINVVTLDEYATISSPDASPASPSVLQDKLKITLPVDEFTAKSKTPKHQSGARRSSEDSVFHFTEESLFSRSKSALLVEGDGQLPLSPRRVLLPPAPTQTSSPRLSKPADPESFAQQKATVHKFFGDTVDEVEEENWASFPEPSPTIEAPAPALVPGFDLNTRVDVPGSPSELCEKPGRPGPELLTDQTENWTGVQAGLTNTCEPPSQVSAVLQTDSPVLDNASTSSQSFGLSQEEPSDVTEQTESSMKSVSIEPEASASSPVPAGTVSQHQSQPDLGSSGLDIPGNLTHLSDPERNLENLQTKPTEQNINFNSDSDTFQQLDLATTHEPGILDADLSLCLNKELSHISRNTVIIDHLPSTVGIEKSVPAHSVPETTAPVTDAFQRPSAGVGPPSLPSGLLEQPHIDDSDPINSRDSSGKANTNTIFSVSEKETHPQSVPSESSQHADSVLGESSTQDFVSEGSAATRSLLEDSSIV